MSKSLVRFAIGAAGYLAITFPLAYVWHLIAFKKTYETLGYFSREEPIVAFGFASILIQGLLLSWIFPRLCQGKSFWAGALSLLIVMGKYQLTMHVLAEAAKHQIEPLSTWFALESAYLAIQFALGGFWLALVYREQR
jgi:hypothetical protein